MLDFTSGRYSSKFVNTSANLLFSISLCFIDRTRSWATISIPGFPSFFAIFAQLRELWTMYSRFISSPFLTGGKINLCEFDNLINPRRMREGYGTWFVINPRRMREGYGTWFVVRSLTLGACARVTVLGLSFIHSLVRSFCPSSCRDHHSLLKLGKGMNRLSTTMACNVTRGFS